MTKDVDINIDVVPELKALRCMMKGLERLKIKHELLKSQRVLLRTKSEIFAFIDHAKKTFPVKVLTGDTGNQREWTLKK